MLVDGLEDLGTQACERKRKTSVWGNRRELRCGVWGGWVLIGLLQACEVDCIDAREERRHARRMQFGVHVSRSTSFVFG